VKGYTIQQ